MDWSTIAVALIAAELPAIALAETTDAAAGMNGAAVPAEAASTDGQAQGNALGSSTGETDPTAGTPGFGTDPSDGTGSSHPFLQLLPQGRILHVARHDIVPEA